MLFDSFNLGGMSLANRLARSACYEGLAGRDGTVGHEMVRLYRNLARGGAGLIISGHMCVHPSGRAQPFQTGIDRDDLVPGLSRICQTVHQEGGRIVFQLSHAGQQTDPRLVGGRAWGVGRAVRDPMFLVKPRPLDQAMIEQLIQAFAQAAGRSVEAGADGVQIHAAHTYLISQFLSPFFNQRDDAWGGDAARRFAFLGRVIQTVQESVPQGFPVLVKFNGRDYTPKPGVTPGMARDYAARLARLGITGLEVSCGSGLFSFMNMARGRVPVQEMVSALTWWKRPIGRLTLGKLQGKYDLGTEPYNLEPARVIREGAPEVPLLVVGGFRERGQMEAALAGGGADLVSMCRPLIREPFLPRRLAQGRAERASCISCNRCLAAIIQDKPVRCYWRGD